MKKFFVGMSAVLFAGATVFAQLGPKPQVVGSTDLAFAMPFAKVQILEVSNFKLDYPRDSRGNEHVSFRNAAGTSSNARYTWLYFSAKIKNPSGKRILLKDFVGQASLRFISPNGVKEVVEIDANGNPIVRKLYDDLILGSYRVANGQVFTISTAEDRMEFMINLGPICNGPQDKLEVEMRNKLLKLFNIFSNGKNTGEYELRLTGKAVPGILGDNGAWVFGNTIDYLWVFSMKDSSGIAFNVKATEAK